MVCCICAELIGRNLICSLSIKAEVRISSSSSFAELMARYNLPLSFIILKQEVQKVGVKIQLVFYQELSVFVTAKLF
jgi:hypothetical protein